MRSSRSVGGSDEKTSGSSLGRTLSSGVCSLRSENDGENDEKVIEGKEVSDEDGEDGDGDDEDDGGIEGKVVREIVNSAREGMVEANP